MRCEENRRMATEKDMKKKEREERRENCAVGRNHVALLSRLVSRRSVAHQGRSSSRYTPRQQTFVTTDDDNGREHGQ
ncbi:unnamed protein product [Nippostrongylus brasiliensis]|uniref:Uncharacterized protein n=1 Tax=Nippostrongylus brasiliensis TaxID=27835 RepID=A0A0N4Y024_NIPBR|nr:unnamed protein product [Nippostrongylus brasiliensis]